jgi:tryptophan-rich sensory protein
MLMKRLLSTLLTLLYYQMTTYCPPFEIRTVEGTVEARENIGRRYFTRPWHILQWMRDPDMWISNIARLNHNNRRRYVPFQPDALLFPSTWPPLHVLTLLAMARAIRISLLRQEPSTVYLLLRKFCITQVLYEEWYRVFLKEKRVALAAAVHGVFLLSLANLIYNAALVDGIAGLLLVPAKLASLVTGWMNIVLYNERVVSNSGGRQQRGQHHHGKRQKPATTTNNLFMGNTEDSRWTQKL